MTMITEYIQARKAAFDAISSLESDIQTAAESLLGTLRNGNKIITCGNGGSAAEAQHFSTELIGRFKSDRRSLPAMSLNADSSAITCISNDFGADFIFSRQLEGIARSGDSLVVFSSSGNSANIVQVLRTAASMGLHSLALLGKDGGQCRGMAASEIIIPSDSTAVVQELHLFLLHFICERIEEAFR